MNYKTNKTMKEVLEDRRRKGESEAVRKSQLG
jgi:hypothetical protein